MSILTLCLIVFTWNVVFGLRLTEPEGALPKLPYDYAPKGVFDNIDGLPFYYSEQREDPGRCVVWAYDVYGWQSPGRGRDRQAPVHPQTGGPRSTAYCSPAAPGCPPNCGQGQEAALAGARKLLAAGAAQAPGPRGLQVPVHSCSP